MNNIQSKKRSVKQF